MACLPAYQRSVQCSAYYLIADTTAVRNTALGMAGHAEKINGWPLTRNTLAQHSSCIVVCSGAPSMFGNLFPSNIFGQSTQILHSSKILDQYIEVNYSVYRK
ncbi:Hypothetical_protein [Hexamita inflata]|uniref:Hypothetical_protein n=1 Tax=Hexamita inflata TaxID=28002 RepID=A0ABP1GNA9_9EUKA